MKRKRKKLNHRYIQAVLEEIRPKLILIIDSMKTIHNKLDDIMKGLKVIQGHFNEIKACCPEYSKENLHTISN